jgi:hypothetical protein
MAAGGLGKGVGWKQMRIPDAQMEEMKWKVHFWSGESC